MHRNTQIRTVLPLAALLALTLPAHAQEPVPPPAGAPQDWTVPATPAPAPISAAEYAQRRAALMQRLQGDGVLVVLGSEEPEADYMPYGQNANFRYLTGVTEPGAALVVARRGEQVAEHLLVLPRNPAREVWEGARMGSEGARARTGIPARTVDGLNPLVDSLLAATPRLWSVVSVPASPDAYLSVPQQFVRHVQRRNPGVEVENALPAILNLRAVKSPAELTMLRRAIYITSLAHREVARAVAPGLNEFEIQALLEGTFRRYGAERPAFSSIVGSGPNSTTLHYRDADRFMQVGEVVVVDVGASYAGYAADVTRTYPVSGRFSPEQREVYQIVLDAQKAAEAEARPGVSFAHISQIGAGVVAGGLARLGLIDAADARYDCEQGGRVATCDQYRIFYMHGLGHGIGLAVHDPDPGYPQHGGAFRVGSAFTIEPGIYVRADAFDYLPDTPGNRAMIQRLRPALERYRNIGVRIEDDYFITETGVERVTEGAPREIAEIEALMAEESSWNQQRRPGVVEWYRGVSPH
jgi:Xaa-Pro aminopeptidase